MFKRLLEYLLERGREGTTWLGLLTLLATWGVEIPAEIRTEVVTALSTLVGIVLFFVRQKATLIKPK